eukprot:scaffold2043_cov39-Cyclotella_meneghiniana.AAC.1
MSLPNIAAPGEAFSTPYLIQQYASSQQRCLFALEAIFIACDGVSKEYLCWQLHNLEPSAGGIDHCETHEIDTKGMPRRLDYLFCREFAARTVGRMPFQYIEPLNVSSSRILRKSLSVPWASAISATVSGKMPSSS